MDNTLLVVALLTASANQPETIGFSCIGIEGTAGTTRFNIDMKRRKWQSDDGNNHAVTITDTEVRKKHDSYAFARGLITSDILSRIDLAYRRFLHLESLGSTRRWAYKCQMTNPINFKQGRQF